MSADNKGCARCKALRLDGSEYVCRLGHPIDQKAQMPKEPCERPLTYLELNEYEKEKEI